MNFEISNNIAIINSKFGMEDAPHEIKPGSKLYRELTKPFPACSSVIHLNITKTERRIIEPIESIASEFLLLVLLIRVNEYPITPIAISRAKVITTCLIIYIENMKKNKRKVFPL